MRPIALLLLALLAAACAADERPTDATGTAPIATADAPPPPTSTPQQLTPAPEPAVHAVGERGITLALPEGWDVVAVPGLLVAASGAEATRHDPLPAGAVRITVMEHADDARWNADFEPTELPLAMVPDTYGRYPEDYRSALPPGQTGAARDVRIAGRNLHVAYGFGAAPVPPELAARANAVLATLAVGPPPPAGEPLPAPAFPARPGWTVGATTPTPPRPEGDQAIAWASTIPYRNQADELPPRATLEALPPDGIVVWFGISRSPGEAIWGPDDERLRDAALPYRLPPGSGCCWEGQIRDLPLYRIAGRDPRGYTVDVWIFFGRAHPTSAQRAAAQAMLDGLQLPIWPPPG